MRQQLIALCRQVAGVQFIESRVCDLEGGGKIVRQPVAGDGEAVEDSGAFCREPPALDAVEVQYRDMRRKTRPDGRTGIGLRPVDDVGEVPPECFLAKRCAGGLRAGDDQSVDLQAIDFGDVGILLVDAPSCRLRSFHGRQRKAVEIDANVSGGLPQQPHELAFRRLQRAVRHVVDEPDREVDIDILRMVKFILSPLLRRHEARTDDQPAFFQQERHVKRVLISYSAASSRGCVVQAAASAWSISSMMSQTCSIPIESRMVSGWMPAMRCCSADIWRWVVEAGWQASDLASPILTSRVISFSES